MIAVAMNNALDNALVHELSFPIGPGIYTPDGAFIVGTETSRVYAEVDDQSILHHGYMALPLANVIPPLYGPVPSLPTIRRVLTYWGVEIGGANWTGMPSSSAAAILRRSDGVSPFPLSALDPAASAGDMNSVRRIEHDYSATPITITPTESYSIELQSPRNGTGSSRYTRYYRVILRFAEIITLADGDHFLAPLTCA